MPESRSKSASCDLCYKKVLSEKPSLRIIMSEEVYYEEIYCRSSHCGFIHTL